MQFITLGTNTGKINVWLDVNIKVQVRLGLFSNFFGIK